MSAFVRLRDALPAGKTLPPDVWQRRHRAMVVLVWLHAVGLLIYGLYGYSHSRLRRNLGAAPVEPADDTSGQT